MMFGRPEPFHSGWLSSPRSGSGTLNENHDPTAPWANKPTAWIEARMFEAFEALGRAKIKAAAARLAAERANREQIVLGSAAPGRYAAAALEAAKAHTAALDEVTRAGITYANLRTALADREKDEARVIADAEDAGLRPLPPDPFTAPQAPGPGPSAQRAPSPNPFRRADASRGRQQPPAPYRPPPRRRPARDPDPNPFRRGRGDDPGAGPEM